MGLHFSLNVVKPVEIFSTGCTHNLTEMAEAFGLYDVMWHPESLFCGDGPIRASMLVPFLKKGIVRLKANPTKAKSYNPENGYGNYETLLRMAMDILNQCESNPDAIVEVDV